MCISLCFATDFKLGGEIRFPCTGWTCRSHLKPHASWSREIGARPGVAHCSHCPSNPPPDSDCIYSIYHILTYIYHMIQADTCPYRRIQTHTYSDRNIQPDTRRTEYRHIWHIYIIQANTCTVVCAYMSFFWKKIFFHQIQANTSKYRHILAYTSKYKPSAPASAGGTDRDLAVPQFTQNCGAYNIIEF